MRFMSVCCTKLFFAFKKQNEKIYIQVADDICHPETFKREVASLLKIRDAYPRMIIARTRHSKTLYEGIEIWDAAQWLLTDITEK